MLQHTLNDRNTENEIGSCNATQHNTTKRLDAWQRAEKIEDDDEKMIQRSIV